MLQAGATFAPAETGGEPGAAGAGVSACAAMRANMFTAATTANPAMRSMNWLVNIIGFKSLRRLLLGGQVRRIQVSRIHDHRRDSPPDAIVHLRRQNIILTRGIEIEFPCVRPMAHDAQPVE